MSGTIPTRPVQLPPSRHDLEDVILGAVLLEPAALVDVVSVLSHPDFFDSEKHRVIYEVVLDMHRKGTQIDIRTVSSAIRELPHQYGINAAFITGLTMNVNSSAHITTHCRIVQEKWIKRQLIRISQAIMQQAYQDTIDAFQMLDDMNSRIMEISQNLHSGQVKTAAELMRSVMSDLERMMESDSLITGVPSGFTKLDQATTGFNDTDLVIIAGRPGMGKTAFLMSAVRNAAIDFGKKVLVFSLEMPGEQLMKRVVASELRIPAKKFRAGMNQNEFDRVVNETSAIIDANILIADSSAQTLNQIKAETMRIDKKVGGLDLIVIDYLQIIKSINSRTNKHTQVSEIARGLKNFARDFGKPVVALAQLSRSVETRGGDKKPQMADLRESGGIEEAADQIMMLYRPEYYDISEDENGMPTEKLLQVILEKNRHGALETIDLHFEGEFTKVSNDSSDAAMSFSVDDFDYGQMPTTTEF